MSNSAESLRQHAEQLRADRRPFVTATVVRAERPTSAKAGDSALVLDDGRIIGFVGGECAEASVLVQALAALESREPVLLRITPEATPAAESQAGGGAPGDDAAGTGAVTVHNPCLSGGTLEIFLEPVVPPLLVGVHGDAPIARAVRELARWLGFEVGSTDEVVPGTAAVVVASHGRGEKDVIEQALRAGVPYIALVASPRRGDAVLAQLEIEAEEQARVHTPAGLDIGSRTPEEVALSVLAEIVSLRPRPRRQGEPDSDGATAGEPQPAQAVDPVCHMTVARLPSSRQRDYEGVRYYFCGAGCEQAFAADPDSFVRR